MKEKERTIFRENQPAKAKAQRTAESLKWVTVGGGTALLLGSAVFISSIIPDETEPVSDEEKDTQSEDVHEEVVEIVENTSDDSTGSEQEPSFEEAFASAREASGPGGVFTWNGNTYSTYLREEWDQLSPEQQDEYVADTVTDTELQQAVDGELIDLAENVEVEADEGIPAEEEAVDADDVEVTEVQAEDVPVEQEPLQEEALAINVEEEEVIDAEEGNVPSDDSKSFIDQMVEYVSDVLHLNESEESVPAEDVVQYNADAEEEIAEDIPGIVEVKEETGNIQSSPEENIDTSDNLDPDLPDYMNDACM